ncbi:MAG: acyl carrier protein [Erysipelotrichia bacterium]|nr:acyl carrier protein [Erysipelotrichia bacterium]
MESLEIVKNALKDRVDIEAIKLEDKLDDLGLDSLDLVEAMLKIEEVLHVEFTSDEIVSLKIVKDLVNLIESKKS